MTEKDDFKFEKAMKELEEVVQKLEEGDVPLEKAVDYYKKGMKLSQLCHDKLQHVEKEVAQLMNADGESEAFKAEDYEE